MNDSSWDKERRQGADPLADIARYSPRMTVSRVSGLLGQKGFRVTKATVQNYLRIGVLPPPIGKLYTPGHVMMLVMIERLKAVFGLVELKRFFELAFAGAVKIPEQEDEIKAFYDACINSMIDVNEAVSSYEEGAEAASKRSRYNKAATVIAVCQLAASARDRALEMEKNFESE
ncbi:MAG: DUF1836 domain-containing protein [Clostridiales bacterium]|nr:DUF1836 domain-containing protein [Clostridiales bacterium]